MTSPQTPMNPESERRRTKLTVVILAVVVLMSAGLVYYAMRPVRLGLAQPIPFSHRFHVSTKGLNCFLCHPGAIDTERSGVPPLETCMLCHKHVIIDHPEIVKLREHYDAGQPIEWVRVNDLPDFVYFDHSVHVHAGVDCGRCHGDIAKMDRVELDHSFRMGFCVQCHRDYGVTHDCTACHR